VVCSGVVYQYVREALPEASTLKIGLSYPLSTTMLDEFAEAVDAVYVAEEADDYLARQLRLRGIEVRELDLPRVGELSPGIISAAFGRPAPELREAETSLPPRPPMMCPGCPHRPAFAALRKMRAVVTGDIGCYTLGALAPLAVDNRITAMTGHQGNPVNGITLQQRPSREVDLEALVRALGVDQVRTVDAHDLTVVEASIREAVAEPGVSVVITKAPCALLVRDRETAYGVDPESCTACGVCVRLGCPAISKGEDSKAEIDVSLCVGCAQCVQVCRYDAIVHAGPACDLGGV